MEIEAHKSQHSNDILTYLDKHKLCPNQDRQDVKDMLECVWATALSGFKYVRPTIVGLCIDGPLYCLCQTFLSATLSAHNQEYILPND